MAKDETTLHMVELTEPAFTTESLEFQNIAHNSGKDTKIEIPIANICERPEDTMQESSTSSMWSIKYYRGYFDVTTYRVMYRLSRSMLPIGTVPFFEENKPDLYGPFWVTTTLAILVAMTGNFASYLEFDTSQGNLAVWTYDFEIVTASAIIFYLMITIVPLLVWFGLKRLGVAIQFVEISSLYGYSLSLYIPSALICITPIEVVRWLTFLSSFVLSSSMILRNIWFHSSRQIEQNPKAKGGVIVVLCAVLSVQAFVTIFTKIWFYTY